MAGAQHSADELKAIVADLKAEFQFGLARKVLTKASPPHSEDHWFQQQLALCTYKDEELQPDKRYADAIEILEEIGLRDEETQDAETLALGGAVYKRRWEYGGQLEYLYESLSFYRAAHERNPQQDMGYGGINAAYILQILAARVRAAAKRSGTEPVEARKFERQATELRREIVKQLSERLEKDPSLEKQNWFVVTLAEAQFGLGNYIEAETLLSTSKQLGVSEWERQTTFRQLVSIARLKGIELPDEDDEEESWDPAWKTLFYLLEGDTVPALTCYRGKVGLSLSGGGFRASLYHIGVLAHLAEMDVLRSVEALSTVSGGSIVGAHYYLLIKHLLETKEDKDITRGDYIDIIRQLQKDFLKGVQRNIRMLAFADFTKNLEMIFSKTYGRSHRLGELYEEELFSKVSDNHPKGQPRLMRNMLIQPKGEQANFNPKFSNWRRRAKVPALLLNATSLNSGHNWRFTARSMGEPPGLTGSEVDKNARYRRLWYEQAPTDELKNYRLGYAVAASACVPGLFDPLTLAGLYEDKVVRLVDGGVHDNQGVKGLLDEGCTYVLCSDASGQMADKDSPSNGLPAVLMRTNSIMMDRIREAEYQDLRGRLDSMALQGMFFVHLKQGLQPFPQDWIDCQDPTPESAKTEAGTPYGVDPDLQRRLAALRTDLDSFTEVEAYALMCSGYLMAAQQFDALQKQHEKAGEVGSWGGYRSDASREAWDFLNIEPVLKIEDKADFARKDLEKQLKVGASLALKPWKLDERLQIFGWALIALAIACGLAIVIGNWRATLFTLTAGGLVMALIAIGLPMLPAGLKKLSVAYKALSFLKKWGSLEKAYQIIVKDTLIAFGGSFLAKLHLWKFDKIFLQRGELKRLLKKR